MINSADAEICYLISPCALIKFLKISVEMNKTSCYEQQLGSIHSSVKSVCLSNILFQSNILDKVSRGFIMILAGSTVMPKFGLTEPVVWTSVVLESVIC